MWEIAWDKIYLPEGRADHALTVERWRSSRCTQITRLPFSSHEHPPLVWSHSPPEARAACNGQATQSTLLSEVGNYSLLQLMQLALTLSDQQQKTDMQNLNNAIGFRQRGPTHWPPMRVGCNQCWKPFFQAKKLAQYSWTYGLLPVTATLIDIGTLKDILDWAPATAAHT